VENKSVIDFIKTRRAIYPKMFSGEIIPEKQIEELLDAAHWAPSHKHTEPWQFVVFTGDGLKKLANFQAKQYKQKSQEEASYSEDKYQKLLTKPLMCSHVIAVAAKHSGMVPHQEDICAASCAVQNLWLTASAIGLGCYWSTGGTTFYPKVNSFFGLEEKDTLLGFINLGIMDKPWPKGKRGNMEDKVTWVTNNN
jgi:nitroreductase